MTQASLGDRTALIKIGLGTNGLFTGNVDTAVSSGWCLVGHCLVKDASVSGDNEAGGCRDREVQHTGQRVDHPRTHAGLPCG